MNYVRAFWNAVREGGVARKLAPDSGGRVGKVAKWPLVLAGGVAGTAGDARNGLIPVHILIEMAGASGLY